VEKKTILEKKRLAHKKTGGVVRTLVGLGEKTFMEWGRVWTEIPGGNFSPREGRGPAVRKMRKGKTALKPTEKRHGLKGERGDGSRRWSKENCHNYSQGGPNKDNLGGRGLKLPEGFRPNGKGCKEREKKSPR